MDPVQNTLRLLFTQAAPPPSVAHYQAALVAGVTTMSASNAAATTTTTTDEMTARSAVSADNFTLRRLGGDDAVDASTLAVLDACCFEALDGMPTADEFNDMCENWRRILDDDDDSAILHGLFLKETTAAGETTATLVGLAHFSYHDHGRRVMPELYINELLVWPNYQGLGLGNTMLARAEQLARLYCRPSVALTLRVNKRNTRALELYARRGFRPLSVAQRRRLARHYPGYTFLQRIVRGGCAPPTTPAGGA